MSDEWPIVVGVDGSESATDAVLWAADRAREQDATVRLIAAAGWAHYRAMGPRALDPESYRQAALTAAGQHLRAATDAAARILPTTRIRSEVREGGPAEVLQDESARASLLVLGSRGRGGFRGLLLGSSAVTLAAAARCPVVVVRARPTPDGPVAVGVDGSPASETALGFAFETAARRRAPLLAVHAWQEEIYDPAVVVLIDQEAEERREQDALEQALAGWRGTFPDVEVVTRVVHGPASGALVEASSGAQLLVVGSRGRGGMAGLVLGSASQAALHHASCPVAVVRGTGDRPVEP